MPHQWFFWLRRRGRIEQGDVVESWGTQGDAPGQFQLPHMLSIDQTGNLYVAEVLGKRAQKLKRN